MTTRASLDTIENSTVQTFENLVFKGLQMAEAAVLDPSTEADGVTIEEETAGRGNRLKAVVNSHEVFGYDEALHSAGAVAGLEIR